MAFTTELKSGNYVISVEKKAFDKIRKTIVTRFSDQDSLEQHGDVDFHDNNKQKQCAQSVKVFHGRRSKNNFKRPLYTINFYLTTHSIMVNGPSLHVFIDDVLPEMQHIAAQSTGNVLAPTVNENKKQNKSSKVTDKVDNSAAANIDQIESDEEEAAESQPDEEVTATSHSVEGDLFEQCEEVVAECQPDGDNNNKRYDNLVKTPKESHTKSKSKQTCVNPIPANEDLAAAIHRIDKKLASVLSEISELTRENKKIEKLVENQKGFAKRLDELEKVTKKQETTIKKLDTSLAKTKSDVATKISKQKEAINEIELKVIAGEKTAEKQQQKIIEIEKMINDPNNSKPDTFDSATIFHELNKNVINPITENLQTMARLMNSQPVTQPTAPQQSSAKTEQRYITVNGQKDPLSNYYPCNMEYSVRSLKQVTNTLLLRSAEQLYQYRKAMFLRENKLGGEILNCKSAAEAKWLGSKLKNHNLIDEWNGQRKDVMKEILMSKAQVCETFKNKLLNTGDRIIYHTVTDKYWGIGKESCELDHPLTKQQVVGNNIHGELLMGLRNTIQRNNANLPQSPEPPIQPPQYQPPQHQPPQHQQPQYQPPQYQPQQNEQLSQQQRASHSSRRKPKVALIGNSLLNGIVPRAVTNKCEMSVVRSTDIRQARQSLETYPTNEKPEIVGLQVITNEARETHNPTRIAQQCTTDIVDTVNLHNDTKFIICLAPPRGDDERSQAIQEIVNNNLKLILNDKPNIYFIDMNGLDFNEYYQNDRLHLNNRGSSVLAFRYKRVINDIVAKLN